MKLIIGGGISGLHIAQHLESPYTLVEAAPRLGGRVRTVYGDEERGGLSYESGPWRIPVAHKRALACFQEHRVRLVPASSRIHQRDEPVVPGLSVWEATALRTGNPLEADALDLKSGYADQTHSAGGSEPYMAKGPFLVAPAGFSTLVERMSERVARQCRTECRVEELVLKDETDPTQGYVATLVQRRGSNRFVRELLECDTVFVCVPPSSFRDWTVFRRYAHSLSCAVTPGQLQHVYVHDPRHPRERHDQHPLLGQVVSSQYENSDWFQISYSSGRVARMWRNLELSQPDTFWNRMQALVRDAWGFVVDPRAEHRTHFWPVAYHKWRAVPGFHLQQAVEQSIVPNPVCLPNLYCAGEAFSSHQAWIEGALETAEKALHAYRFTESGSMEPAGETSLVRVEGRVIDVSKWESVHPGGAFPLRNHRGEDVTELMRMHGHSEFAWAVVHSMKRG